MTESALQAKMQKLLQQHGFFTRKVSAENSRGLPDLLVIGHGMTALIEVKIVGGRLSAVQKKTTRTLLKMLTQKMTCATLLTYKH